MSFLFWDINIREPSVAWYPETNKKSVLQSLVLEKDEAITLQRICILVLAVLNLLGVLLWSENTLLNHFNGRRYLRMKKNTIKALAVTLFLLSGCFFLANQSSYSDLVAGFVIISAGILIEVIFHPWKNMLTIDSDLDSK